MTVFLRAFIYLMTHTFPHELLLEKVLQKYEHEAHKTEKGWVELVYHLGRTFNYTAPPMT